MRALPEKIAPETGPHVTGVSCVECPGSLTVEKEGGKGLLTFRCRIGHTFSAHEVVAGKEKQLEDRFWALVLGMAEFAAVLADLGEHEEKPEIVQSYRERIERLMQQERALRQLVEQNEPVDLTPKRTAAQRDDEPTEGGK